MISTLSSVKHHLVKKNLLKKIINISNLVDSNKDEITFFDNIKYINDLKKTKASFCLVKKNLSHI